MTDPVPESDVIAPWSATGIGSLPGTDPAEAARIVVGEFPHLPHLPELPNRGPGADLVGRTLGMLAGVSGAFAAQTGPDGWRRSAGVGRDMRRAQTFLRDDVDALTGQLDGYRGVLTVGMAGPWTTAAVLRDVWGERVLRDRGFVTDLGVAMSEAATALLEQVKSGIPGARLRLQLDEPALASVMAGEVPFSSGYRHHSPIPPEEMAAGLRHSADAAHGMGAELVLHACAHPAWSVVEALRPDHLSIDISLLVGPDTEHLGRWLESGAGTVWGVWPAAGEPAANQADRGYGEVRRWLDRLGLRASEMRAPMAVSPRCGLGGATPGQARRAMAGVREIARRLADPD